MIHFELILSCNLNLNHSLTIGSLLKSQWVTPIIHVIEKDWLGKKYKPHSGKVFQHHSCEPTRGLLAPVYSKTFCRMSCIPTLYYTPLYVFSSVLWGAIGLHNIDYKSVMCKWTLYLYGPCYVVYTWWQALVTIQGLFRIKICGEYFTYKSLLYNGGCYDMLMRSPWPTFGCSRVSHDVARLCLDMLLE